MKCGDAKVLLAVMVGLAVFMVMTELVHGAIKCDHVEIVALPCVHYMKVKAPKPSAICCDALRTLKKEALTTADRRATCECFVNAASHVPDIKKDLMATLPKKCGIDLGFPISPSTKCNRIP